MGHVRNLKGQRFGLRVVEEFVAIHNGQAVWRVRCACGSVSEVQRSTLVTAQSCGCVQPEAARRARTLHGGSPRTGTSKTYRIWQRMKARCFTPSASRYRNYGGRGVTVCDQWKGSFQSFLNDMGECPPGHSIERMDVNGNYEPGNCCWIPLPDQQRNTTRSRFVELGGQRMCLSEAARTLGIHPRTLSSRIAAGWSDAELSRPPSPRRRSPKTPAPA